MLVANGDIHAAAPGSGDVVGRLCSWKLFAFGSNSEAALRRVCPWCSGRCRIEPAFGRSIVSQACFLCRVIGGSDLYGAILNSCIT